MKRPAARIGGGRVGVLAAGPLLGGVAALALAGCAATPSSAPTSVAMSAAAPAAGYLDEATLAELTAGVPEPSAPGSAESLADIARSERLRALEGGDRWLLATAHAELSPSLARQHFDCALSVRFTATETPRLIGVLQRILHDANTAAEAAKARAFRPRPVGADAERRACQRLTEAARASASYPSGSATVGAAYGEVFAALAPDQATKARRIGHEIGVSRIVCAMHYPADVAAGEALGQAVFARTMSLPAFQGDLAVARTELAKARATGLTSPACAAERQALALPLP